MPIERLPSRSENCMTPQPVAGERGLFTVDATWGSISPISIHGEVRTLGELEVIEHIERGHPLVDTRQPEFLDSETLPGAVRIPHEQIRDRLDELDRDFDTVFFCNGPQCTATPQAIATLLALGYPAGRMLWYRGGIHDWVTLGLPTVQGPAP